MKSKEQIYLNEKEAGYFGSIASSIGILATLILTSLALIINYWFFLGVIFITAIYAAVSLVFNYFELKESILKRRKIRNEKRKKL